jgi:hypothetical protein
MPTLAAVLTEVYPMQTYGGKSLDMVNDSELHPLSSWPPPAPTKEILLNLSFYNDPFSNSTNCRLAGVVMHVAVHHEAAGCCAKP